MTLNIRVTSFNTSKIFGRKRTDWQVNGDFFPFSGAHCYMTLNENEPGKQVRYFSGKLEDILETGYIQEVSRSKSVVTVNDHYKLTEDEREFLDEIAGLLLASREYWLRIGKKSEPIELEQVADVFVPAEVSVR